MRRRQAYSNAPRAQVPVEEEPEVVIDETRRTREGYISKHSGKRLAELSAQNLRGIDKFRASLPDGTSFGPGSCIYCGKYIYKGMFTHLRWCQSNPNRQRKGD